jgi:integrase
MKPSFTLKQVDDLPLPADGKPYRRGMGLEGFSVCVYPGGRKTYEIRYRCKAGHSRRQKLGHHPVLLPAEAYAKARKVLVEVEDGRDPAGEKLVMIEAQKRDHADTLDTLIPLFLQTKIGGKSFKEIKRALTQHAKPNLPRGAVRALRKPHVVAAIEAVRDAHGNSTARKVHHYLGGFLRWCDERGVLDKNPMAGMSPQTLLGDSPKRQRNLSDQELRLVMLAADKLPETYQAYVKTLAYCVQRRSEVAGMRRSELAHYPVWTIPMQRMKAGKEHQITLPEQAMALVASLPEVGDPVFTLDGVSPIAAFSRIKNAVTEAIAEVQAELGLKVDPLPQWGLHDLRRSARSRFAPLGIPPHIGEMILAHARDDLETTYDVYRYGAEIAEAIQRWANALDRIADGQPMIAPKAQLKAVA